MLHPKVGNYWLTEIGPFGEVSYSENWLHGCEQAKWGMRARTRHHALTPGARVTIYDKVIPCWTGYLLEDHRDGTFEAVGLHKLGEGALALNASAGATTDPDDAVRNAVGWGDVPWTFSSMPAGAVGDVEPGLTLNALLDNFSSVNNIPWRIDHTGELVLAYPPTTPRWSTQTDENLWTMASDDFVTRIVVTYMSGVSTFPVFEYTTPESLTAAARYGVKGLPLDLTGYGIITLGTAQAYAAAALAATGPRFQLATPFTFAPGQLRTLGDTEAGWGAVHAGQSFRVFGLPDRSQLIPHGYTDVAIGRLERTRSTLTLTSEGAPARNTRDVIAAITAAANAA